MRTTSAHASLKQKGDVMNAVALREVPKAALPVPAQSVSRLFTLFNEGEIAIPGTRKSTLRRLGIEFSYASAGALPERSKDTPEVTGRILRVTENAPLWRIWEQMQVTIEKGIPLSIAHLESIVNGKVPKTHTSLLSGEHDLLVFVSGVDGPAAVLLTHLGFWKGSVFRNARAAHRTLARDTRLILPA